MYGGMFNYPKKYTRQARHGHEQEIRDIQGLPEQKQVFVDFD